MNWESYDKPSFKKTMMADDYTDEQLLKVARMDIDNHIDNGTFYVLGEEPQAFHDGELDGENFYTIVSLYSQHHEDEDKAETILTNMFKKEYPQYLGSESFNAEAIGNEIGCDKCGRFAKLWSYANLDLDLCAICSKKEGFRAEYENIGTMQSTPASGYNGYMNMMSSARRLVEIGNETGLDQKLGEAYQDESGRWFLPILERKASEEPVVQEPDWIPAGDGRAIGQQDFAINLSPLHAESRFDKLSNEIADEYEEKGMSPEKAQEVGDATAAKIGRAKYGKTGMRKMQRKGMKSDTVGNPSPTFNEDITGQDGPSADPTNQTFEAMRTLAPSSDDVNRARRDLKNSGYGDVIYDRYMVNRDGSSNKFYYTAITEKNGQYYPMGAYGRIGYLSKLFNIYGKSESPKASLGSMDSAYRHCSTKEKAKIKRGYVDYTLRMAESYRAESLSQIEGATAEATSGGLHSPSSFDISWEDGNGLSSASMPPNEIAWAEDVKGSEGAVLGGVAVVGLFAVGLIAAMKFNPANKKKDDTKNAEKGCGCSKTVAKSKTVKHSEYSADRINPVEVEGQNDIHNAESITQSSPYAGPQTAHRQNNRPTRTLW